MTRETNNKAGWKQKAAREFAVYLVNFAYLAFFFGAFTWYRRFILAEYQISYLHYGTALIEALVLAKVILIGDFLHLGRGLDHQPLVVPTLYKTITFTIFVEIFELLERAAEGLFHGKNLEAIWKDLWTVSTHEVLSHCLVTFFAFIPFFAFKELGRVLGKGSIRKLFFRKRPTAPAAP